MQPAAATVSSADDPDTQLLFGTLAASFAVSASLLLFWHAVVVPAFPRISTRPVEDRIHLAQSFVSCYPAVTAPFLALHAMQGISFTGSEVMDAAPSTAALVAVGLSCGYMLYDACYILRYKNVPSVWSPLMMGHHLLSVLIWPYAVLRRRALILVLFFVVTEVTNVGQASPPVMAAPGNGRGSCGAPGEGWLAQG